MKRPAYRLLGSLPLLGEGGLRAALRGLARLILAVPRTRRKVRASLGRVLSRSGRPCDEAAVDAVIKEMAWRYAEGLFNLCHICRPAPRIRTPASVELELLPAVERLRGRGRGLILATPHFGDVYSAITALAHAGLPLNVLMVGGHFFKWAEFGGLRFHTLGEGAACLAALRRNELVWLYDDLDYFPGGRLAPFFGQPTFPPHGAARLSQAAGCPILPVYAPIEDVRVRVFCDQPVEPDQEQEAIESALLRSMERAISRYPAQWLTFEDVWDLPAIAARNRRTWPRP